MWPSEPWNVSAMLFFLAMLAVLVVAAAWSCFSKRVRPLCFPYPWPFFRRFFSCHSATMPWIRSLDVVLSEARPLVCAVVMRPMHLLPRPFSFALLPCRRSSATASTPPSGGSPRTACPTPACVASTRRTTTTAAGACIPTTTTTATVAAPMVAVAARGLRDRRCHCGRWPV